MNKFRLPRTKCTSCQQVRDEIEDKVNSALLSLKQKLSRRAQAVLCDCGEKSPAAIHHSSSCPYKAYILKTSD